jgi:hypothetical protein
VSPGSDFFCTVLCAWQADFEEYIPSNGSHGLLHPQQTGKVCDSCHNYVTRWAHVRWNTFSTPTLQNIWGMLVFFSTEANSFVALIPKLCNHEKNEPSKQGYKKQSR